jgi:hypothetical protein
MNDACFKFRQWHIDNIKGDEGYFIIVSIVKITLVPEKNFAQIYNLKNKKIEAYDMTFIESFSKEYDQI